MNTLFANSIWAAALWITIKASAVLGVAAVLDALLRRRGSAATRHLLWTLALAGVLALPAASLVLPSWILPIRTALAPVMQDATAELPGVSSEGPVTASLTARGAPPPRASARRLGASLGPQALLTARGAPPPRALARPLRASPFDPAQGDPEVLEGSLGPQALGSQAPGPQALTAPPSDYQVAASGFSVATLLGGLYATGLIVMLLHLLLQHWRVRRFARRATVVADVEWTSLLAECAARMNVRRPVRLLRSVERNVPMTFGTRRPSIAIPAIADSWSADRRRAVLLHELAHVARLDCLSQTMAIVTCAVYWFHPAAWWAARRLRVERELACDDRVIASGTEARDYAGHLLEIAYSFGARRAPALAVGMARRAQLEGRLLAALDAARNRRVLSLRGCAAGATIAALVVCAVSAARLTLVAADRPEASVTMPEMTPPAVPQAPVVAPSLVEVRGSLQDAAHRLVRAAAASLGVPQSRLPGTWEIRPANTDGMINLRLVELNSSWGSNIAIDRLEGLTGAQLRGDGGPVQFRLRRDAGTFTFEGVIRSGVGAGTFSFTPDAGFPAEMAKRGFARPTPAEQYDLARGDIGFAFLDELNAQGYTKPQTSELVQAGQHGVHTTYVHDMGALGYRLGSLSALITLRDHGVTPAYARELSDLGYKGLAADDLRKARDHGVSAEYVRAMRDAGYGSLPMDALINARDHGISEDYVRQLRELGYAKMPLDELIRLRDHGVSSDYVRDMRALGFTLGSDEAIRARDHGVGVEFVREMTALGYRGLSIDELIRLRDHGVGADFARDMTALGYKGMTTAELIRLRDHGVSAQYARELKGLGYDSLSIDDLVGLRDHGLTTERIRAANARAGTRLPIDLLKSVGAGGWR